MPDNIASLESLLSRGAVSCDTPAFSLFGISMAGFNALISFVIVALLVYALKTNKVCKEKDGQATP